jgi:hypothetical protein
MPDGSEWDVPAGLVADNRAAHYAHNDTSDTGGEPYATIYKLELEHTLNNHDELVDWAENNMNWSDVSHAATMCKPGPVDYQEGWVNGAKTIVQEP